LFHEDFEMQMPPVLAVVFFMPAGIVVVVTLDVVVVGVAVVVALFPSDSSQVVPEYPGGQTHPVAQSHLPPF